MKLLNIRKTLVISVVTVITGLLIYLFSPSIETSPAFNRPDLRIAVWMGVTWSMDAHDPEDIRQLATRLQSQQVDDVYVYVSYLKAGDFFNPTYDHAQAFVTTLKQFVPDIRVLAWIGVPISITQPDGTYIANRLESDTIREQISEFSHMLITDFGFDGIHLNAELIPNEDMAFLATLETIREMLPEEAYFSTTAHALRLNSTGHSITLSTTSSSLESKLFATGRGTCRSNCTDGI